MKKFILKLALFWTLFLLVLSCVFYITYVWMLRSPYLTLINHSHEINVKVSLSRLEHKTEPSIIIIGGSGCGFGLISGMLSEHFNMPVINTGTHAGLGLRLQLLLVQPYIKKGDIVIVIPEYMQFTDLFYGDETAWRIMMATLPNKMGEISLQQYFHLLRYYPTALENAISYYRGHKNDHSTIEINSISPYSASSLNEYGDVTCYQHRQHKCFIPVSKKNLQVKKYVIKSLKEYKDYCRNNDAMFILFPPAYHEKDFALNKDAILHISQSLAQNGIPYVASPQKYVMFDSLFYDTIYHLTYEGCSIRTNNIIADLDSIINQ